MKTFQQFNEAIFSDEEKSDMQKYAKNDFSIKARSFPTGDWGLSDADIKSKNTMRAKNLDNGAQGGMDQKYIDFITTLSEDGATVDEVTEQLIENFELSKDEAGDLIRQWVLRKK